MNKKQRLIYLLQTKLQTELSDDLIHDIECAIYDTKVETMKLMRESLEKDKVRYYNEIKLWGKRNKNETINRLCGTLEEGGSIR